MTSFGCCSSFKICSDAAQCVKEFEYARGCMYRENLEKGFNFYTEINEKNKAKREKFLQQQQELNIKKSYIESHEENAYIQIDNRYFFIGKRAAYNACSYYLTLQEQQELSNRIGIDVIASNTTLDISKFVDEMWSPINPAWYRPILTINDEKYNIMNYNIKALNHKTVQEIKGYFDSKGFNVMIETLGARSSFSNTPAYQKKKKQSSTQDKPILSTSPKAPTKQLSLWELVG